MTFKVPVLLPLLLCFRESLLLLHPSPHPLILFYSAIKVAGSRLSDQRIVIYGAGSAGMGIADQIKDGLMILEGLNKDEAARRFWCVDRNGLLVESMGNGLRHSQMPYARPDAEVEHWNKEDEDRNGIWLMDVIKNVKPTVLIGTSTHSRAFSEELVREMVCIFWFAIVKACADRMNRASTSKDPSSFLCLTLPPYARLTLVSSS